MNTSSNNEPFTAEQIASELCCFLHDNIFAAEIDFNLNSDLLALGVDSFSLMEMILFIERRFSLVLPTEALTPENIASVYTLSHYCATVLNRTDA